MARRNKASPSPHQPERGNNELVPDELQQNAAHVDDGVAEKETRGEKKRKALQLERLGEVLVDLPAAKLARVPLPDDLAAAVTEARRIKANKARGGYRRQVNFIGKIMRTLDAQPIADALESMKGEDAPSAASFKAAERWRDRLMVDGDVALEALVKDHPGADRTKLRQLIRVQSTRALFKELHALFRATSP